MRCPMDSEQDHVIAIWIQRCAITLCPSGLVVRYLGGCQWHKEDEGMNPSPHSY